LLPAAAANYQQAA